MCEYVVKEKGINPASIQNKQRKTNKELLYGKPFIIFKKVRNVFACLVNVVRKPSFPPFFSKANFKHLKSMLKLY